MSPRYELNEDPQETEVEITEEEAVVAAKNDSKSRFKRLQDHI